MGSHPRCARPVVPARMAMSRRAPRPFCLRTGPGRVSGVVGGRAGGPVVSSTAAFSRVSGRCCPLNVAPPKPQTSGKLSSGKPLTSYIAQAELCKSRLNSASYLLTGQFNMLGPSSRLHTTYWVYHRAPTLTIMDCFDSTARHISGGLEPLLTRFANEPSSPRAEPSSVTCRL